MCGGLDPSCLSFGAQVKVRPVVIFAVQARTQIFQRIACQKARYSLRGILRDVREFVHDKRPAAQKRRVGDVDVEAKGDTGDAASTGAGQHRSLPPCFGRIRFQGGMDAHVLQRLIGELQASAGEQLQSALPRRLR